MTCFCTDCGNRAGPPYEGVLLAPHRAAPCGQSSEVVKRHQPLEYEVYMEKLIYLEKLQELATMNSRTTALLCATLSVPVEIAAGMGLSVPVVVNKISKGQRPAKPSIFHPSADFVTLKQHAPLVLKRSRRRVIGEPVTVAVKAVISAMVPPIQELRPQEAGIALWDRDRSRSCPKAVSQELLPFWGAAAWSSRVPPIVPVAHGAAHLVSVRKQLREAPRRGPGRAPRDEPAEPAKPAGHECSGQAEVGDVQVQPPNFPVKGPEVLEVMAMRTGVRLLPLTLDVEPWVCI
eukprot:g4076.t1